MAEVPVELVVGVLADTARVEHDDVGMLLVVRTSPSATNRAAIRSESCSFIWQPNVRTTNLRGGMASSGTSPAYVTGRLGLSGLRR